MMRRWILLVSLSGVGASGMLAVACSNRTISDDNTTDTGAADNTVPTDGGPGQDVNNKPDTSMGKTCPTYPVTGACDMVAQNCPNNQECVLVMDDGGFSTACMPAKTGTKAKGDMCNSTTDCVPGTECQMGRC